MAKTRRFYYECVLETDLGFWAPDQRKEHWVQKGKNVIQPMKALHYIRVAPSNGMNIRGEPFPPDYIVTDRPLGRQYTEEIEKRVSRPSFDSSTGRRNGRYWRKKVSKIKFRLLDADEIDPEVRRKAIDLPWVDALFEDIVKDVILPKDVAILDKSLPEAIGEVSNG